MKTLKFALLITAITFLTQSCYKRESWGVKGKGDVVSETRDLGGFSRINLSCSAEVTYTQDSLYSVQVSAQSNILKMLKIEVINDELVIDLEGNVWDHKPIKMIVHSPRMKGMTVSGSGNITSESQIKTEDLALKVSGSGNIILFTLNATGIDAKVSGSGNVQVNSGKVTNSVYGVSGSGNIQSDYLQSNTNTTNVSGSGNISLYVTESLNVTISGSGNVSYRGTPIVNANVSGSGKLTHI